MKCRIILIAVLQLSCFIELWAQVSSQVKYVENEHKLQFKSSNGIVLKDLHVDQLNPYMRLGFASTKNNTSLNYTLSETEKASLPQTFFLKGKFSREDVGQVRPLSLSAFSAVEVSETRTVVTNDLFMYGNGTGLVAIKSRAVIYDNNSGNQIAELPENHDGYFHPVVTKNGKFLAGNFGGTSVHSDCSLFPGLGFRIYDLTSGEKIYELSSAGSVDLLIPIVHHDIIIQVVNVSSDRHEFMFFFPDQRIVYKRIFFNSDLPTIKRYTEDGVIMGLPNGSETLISFDQNFRKSSF